MLEEGQEMLRESFRGSCGFGQDGRECLPAYLFLKMGIKAVLIVLKDQMIMINADNSNKVSKRSIFFR